MTTTSPKIDRTFTSRIALLLAAASAAIALPAVAFAHHSQSEFDFRSIVTVEGTVTELSWKSPHARLYVDAVNEAGQVEHWNFVLPSQTTLMRRGWTRKSTNPGVVYTVMSSRR